MEAAGGWFVTNTGSSFKENLTDNKISAACKFYQKLMGLDGTKAIATTAGGSWDTSEFYAGRVFMFCQEAIKYSGYAAEVSSLTTFNKSTENLGIVPLPLLPCNDKKLYPTGWLEAVAACKGVKDLRPAIAWSKFCSTYTNPVQTTTSMRDEDVELVKKLATGNICYSNYGFASTSTDVNTIVTEIESKLIKGNNVATVLSDYRQPVQNCIDSAIH